MMRQESPLRKCHDAYAASLVPMGESVRDIAHRPGAAQGQRESAPEVEYLPYGSPTGEESVHLAIVGSYGQGEAEYAALRRGAGLFDAPHRATLIVTGADRIDYLNRLLSQELKDFAPGQVRRAFLLSRKGRIEADLTLAEFGELILIDVDVHQAALACDRLEASIFIEEVGVRDAGDALHRIDIHGPAALELLGAATDAGVIKLDPDGAISLAIDADAELFVARVDTTGTIGLKLFVPRERVEAVWMRLLDLDASLGEGKHRVRPIGWYAFNIARIEAGTPLMNVDFGPSNLPHETGVLGDRVSFTTGCYPGQEIVARMENLGKPARALAGLRMEGATVPVAGTPVRLGGAQDPGDAIGVITSSCLSPMLGATPVAFAMLKNIEGQGDETVLADADGGLVKARRHDLCFLSEPAGRDSPPAGEVAE